MRVGGTEYLPENYKSDSRDRWVEVHKVHTRTESRRKCVQRTLIKGWIKPNFQPLIAARSLDELVDLALKNDQNGGGRVTFLELGGERMEGEILFVFWYVLRVFSNMSFKIGRGCRLGLLGHRARGGGLAHVEGLKGGG